MDNNKTDEYYLAKAIDNIDAIENYICHKSYDSFLNDAELIDAIMFRLVQLIENLKNVSSEYKTNHSQIPWGKIIGFRNGIVHEYGETDYRVVYETITQDLPILKEHLTNS